VVGEEKTLAQSLLLAFEVGQSTALRPLFVTQHLDQASWTQKMRLSFNATKTMKEKCDVIAVTQQ
jgi:hypothetical protein